MNEQRSYIGLLARSGQITRAEESERLLDRGFWIFVGLLLGLIAAWWLI